MIIYQVKKSFIISEVKYNIGTEFKIIKAPQNEIDDQPEDDYTYSTLQTVILNGKEKGDNWWLYGVDEPYFRRLVRDGSIKIIIRKDI
jgi:hypothetical protein